MGNSTHVSSLSNAFRISGLYLNACMLFKYSPYRSFMQADINEKMRAILIDWLVEVHLKFKVSPITLVWIFSVMTC